MCETWLTAYNRIVLYRVGYWKGMVLYMGKSIKSSIARSLSGNMSLNRKSLHLKRSWDDVEKMLQSVGKKKK